MIEFNLISGGVDSTVMALQNKVIPNIHFNLGGKYSEIEEKKVKNLGEHFGLDIKYEVLEGIADNEQGNKMFVPARNLLMATYVVAKYNADIINIAGIKGDKVCDKSPSAFKKFSQVLSVASNKKVKVRSPFWDKTKGDLIKWFFSRYDEVDWEDVYSCYNGGEKHCGDCPACFRKAVGEKVAGVFNKSMYLVNPLFTNLAETYWNKRKKYNAERCKEIEYALKEIHE